MGFGTNSNRKDKRHCFRLLNYLSFPLSSLGDLSLLPLPLPDYLTEADFYYCPWFFLVWAFDHNDCHCFRVDHSDLALSLLA